MPFTTRYEPSGATLADVAQIAGRGRAAESAANRQMQSNAMQMRQQQFLAGIMEARRRDAIRAGEREEDIARDHFNRRQGVADREAFFGLQQEGRKDIARFNIGLADEQQGKMDERDAARRNEKLDLIEKQRVAGMISQDEADQAALSVGLDQSSIMPRFKPDTDFPELNPGIHGEYDASGQPVIDEATGEQRVSEYGAPTINKNGVSGTWMPNPNDPDHPPVFMPDPYQYQPKVLRAKEQEDIRQAKQNEHESRVKERENREKAFTDSYNAIAERLIKQAEASRTMTDKGELSPAEKVTHEQIMEELGKFQQAVGGSPSSTSPKGSFDGTTYTSASGVKTSIGMVIPGLGRIVEITPDGKARYEPVGGAPSLGGSNIQAGI